MPLIRKAPGAGQIHLAALALAFSTVLLLAAGPVLARQCPRGQILRVSKNLCVPKSEGILSHVFYGSTFHGPSKASAEPEPDAQAAELAPSAEADRPTATLPVKKTRAVPAPSPSQGPSPSPYGELSLESFPKP